MKLTKFLSLLHGVTKSGDGWIAKCPGHEDKKPSLCVSEGKDGRLLLKCQAGCATEAVVAALGLKMGDLFLSHAGKQPHAKRSIAATYDYHDESGKLLFQCVRYEPKDFRQRRPDPAKPGQWLWNLKDTRRVLYRLDEVQAALATGRTIFITEGEKDSDALAKEGFAATCNPMGAGKWLPEHTNTLQAAARLVVIADNDEPGRKHADQVARSLHGKAKSVRVIELPGLNGKQVKDSADYFAAGGTADQLKSIADSTSEFVPGDKTDGGQNGHSLVTPSQWLAERFPALQDEYGAGVLEETDKHGIVSVRDIGEDFLAATLGQKGSPQAPTVFLPTEERFFQYAPTEGIFVNQREPVLLARLSGLLLSCARGCKEGCETRALEFRFRDAASLSGVLRKARGLLEVPDDFFAADLTKFIPCANGMLRLSDRELQAFSPSYRRRNKLAVPYDSGAKCPLFLETLLRPALDQEDIDLLQRWCGLALVGENLAQKILLLTGTAGGGKGTVVRVLVGIIGQLNLAALRPQLLGERFELGRFLGKTLLYGADVPENFLNQRGASVLKSLTGYDPITLEFKNSNESPPITCKFNIIVTCNSRLTVHLEGDTDAWRRRLAIIQYARSRPEHVIAELSERILANEGPGVLNWMLAGLDKLRADGWQLHLAPKQQAIVDNLLLESDGHALFAREYLQNDPGLALTVPDCYAGYVEFCNQRGWMALTRNKFTSVITDEVVRQFGMTTRHDIPDSNGKLQRGWKGLTLRKNFSRPTGKIVSEVSGNGLPDSPDTYSPVQAGRISAYEQPELAPVTKPEAGRENTKTELQEELT